MTYNMPFPISLTNSGTSMDKERKHWLACSSFKGLCPMTPIVYWSVFALTIGLLLQTSSAAGQDNQPVAVSLEQCRKLAEEGNVEAQYKMGTIYEARLGEAQDFKEAAKWYLKAAEKGHAKAQYKLGTMYTQGKGVHQDHLEAARWLGKAAQQGYEPAKRQIQERGTKLKDQLLKEPLGLLQRKPV